MKVAVIGASGRGGSRIVDELVRRGHHVTAIARNTEKIPTGANITVKKGDVNDTGLADLLKGHDAVISTVRFTQSDPELLIGAVKKSGVKRYLVMGGAGLAGSRARQEADRHTAISGRCQTGSLARRYFPGPAASGQGSRLDLPVARRR